MNLLASFRSHRWQRRISPQACLLLLAFPLLFQLTSLVNAAEPTAAEAPAKTGDDGAEASQRFITIDFDNVDIRLFIKYISELTGKNFVIDKAVQGNVTIISPTRISEDDAYTLFESVLEVNGFATVPSGSITKIMPASRVPSQNINTLRHGDASRPEDKIVTQLIPLRNTTPEEMKKVLAPLVSKTSVVIAHTQSGKLIVTETLSNIQKLLAIIESLDVPLIDEEISVIPLEHASATATATAINAIFQQAAASKEGKALTPLKVVPFEPINSIILVASAARSERVRQLISQMDTELKQNEGNIHVVYLQHATAKELATVLTALPGQQSTDPAKKGETPTISKDVKIMPDVETNSLIITASRSEFRELEGVIKKLDIPRRMVYLEALILEVDTDASFNVGVNWMAGGEFSDGTGTGLAGFSGKDGYKLTDTLGLSTTTDDDGNVTVSKIPSIASGFTMGVLKQGIQIGDVTFPNIGAILKAYKGNSHVNVIATPQILTTDNKKAEISVGENVPYQTRVQESYNSNSSSSSSSSLFSSSDSIGYANYEYKDIATKLTITPSINQADVLRLEIATEVSKLKDSSDALKPATFKRTTSTTVVVKDNDTVVLGGIIGQDDTESESKLPILGDIPALGWLFKEHKTSTKKTNMFIFITPRIIKNPSEMQGVTAIKTDDLEKEMPEVKQLLTNPTNGRHVMSMVDHGFELMQAGKLAEAREQFNKVLTIDSHNPYARFNLATLCEKEGKNQEAIRWYQMILDTSQAKAAVSAPDALPADSPLLITTEENLKRLQKITAPASPQDEPRQ